MFQVKRSQLKWDLHLCVRHYAGSSCPLTFICRKQNEFELEKRKRRNVYLHVVGVNELVLGAP